MDNEEITRRIEDMKGVTLAQCDQCGRIVPGGDVMRATDCLKEKCSGIYEVDVDWRKPLASFELFRAFCPVSNVGARAARRLKERPEDLMEDVFLSAAISCLEDNIEPAFEEVS